VSRFLPKPLLNDLDNQWIWLEYRKLQQSIHLRFCKLFFARLLVIVAIRDFFSRFYCKLIYDDLAKVGKAFFVFKEMGACAPWFYSTS